LEDTLSAINNLEFTQNELTAIDKVAVESDINPRAEKSSAVGRCS
jgi:L-glyceraldehyde 3-phosphate reductase